jgi:hypothetical protein
LVIEASQAGAIVVGDEGVQVGVAFGMVEKAVVDAIVSSLHEMFVFDVHSCKALEIWPNSDTFLPTAAKVNPEPGQFLALLRAAAQMRSSSERWHISRPFLIDREHRTPQEGP